MHGVRGKPKPWLHRKKGRIPRCPSCGKARFATWEMAQARLVYLMSIGAQVRRVYKCADTAWYHLTSKR